MASVKGIVKNEFNEIAPYAVIYESNLKGEILKNNATNADDKGYFNILNLDTNNYLTFKMVGLNTATIAIKDFNLASNNEIKLKLSKEVILDEVKVYPKKNYYWLLLIGLVIAYKLRKK